MWEEVLNETKKKNNLFYNAISNFSYKKVSLSMSTINLGQNEMRVWHYMGK